MKSISKNKRIKVTVNGRELEVYDELTILQALIQEDVEIPHLCYDIRLERANGNCGLCVVELGEGAEMREVKSCQTPIQAGMIIRTNSDHLKNYRKVRLAQLLSDHNADCVAPCVSTCPNNVDIQKYLRHIQAGNFTEALQVIKETNPFPVVCGRVCPHPCEAACRRNLVDAPVAINYVKRFVADLDLGSPKPWSPKVKPASGKKIAIIGAGPSGLTAAYYSAINGHDVTVFERQPHAGGMMRYGIPEYRLPKATLDKEIELIRNLGVRIVTGKAVGTHVMLTDLQQDFDAVYLAIGSWGTTPFQLEGVWTGIQYLEQNVKGLDTNTGKEVVVIGGGNTAIDCSRTALRNGAEKVTILYRRCREEMPAEPYEIEEAEHEGVGMMFLIYPEKIEIKGDKKILRCLKMQLGEPDRSGRRRPIPIEGSEIIIEADTVIAAIGQSTDTRFLYNDLPVRLNKWGDVDINGRTFETSESKIFAGGDCVTGPATVIQAIAAGRHAAESIDSFLTVGYAKVHREDYSCSRGSLEDLPRWMYEDTPRLPRTVMPALDPEIRKKNYAEVELGLSEEQAVAEAERCLQCGCKSRYDCDLRNAASDYNLEFKSPDYDRPFFPITDDHPFITRDHNKCISCGRCITACAEVEGPDILTFYMKHGRQLVGTKSGRPLEHTDCISCGHCVNACPCGALRYTSEKGKVFRALHDPSKTVVAFVAPAVRAIIATRYGISPEAATPFIAGLLKQLGFDKVFDNAFAADLTIMEETTEFLDRVTGQGVMPQFTSCCPGWVNFVERRYPEIIPHLSTCKSPQMMMGATIKNHFAQMAGLARQDLYVVSIVPCIAKKYEAKRPEFATDGIPDVDAVLNSVEMLEMMDLKLIDPADVVPQEYDEPYRMVSGAGILFGNSGGVAEAALRMAVEKLSGVPLADHLDFTEIRGFDGVKETTIEANGVKVRVAVISGLHNAEPIIQKVARGEEIGYDLIEIMACPGGCISGAGHPVPEKIDSLEKREQVLIDIDMSSKIRKSQDNPDIMKLYQEFYGQPNSQLAHELLHTHYYQVEGDTLGAKVLKKSDSAFLTNEFEICVCDACSAKGSKELYQATYNSIHAQKMDAFVKVRTTRLKAGHAGEGIHVILDGKKIEAAELSNIYKAIRANR
ncbi:Iron hydrogenase 1 [Sporotomaculum syntrophicum]|uniref:Iron hydrogenase 1 n=1 Tax=Sporotomaculum syntrophicum TaxID=182264 RepID=A0A9D3AYY0_9FIRM|nr:[FeFe] hydrogenase, group A [Sporotomaculum syntrophicum]KAF1085289.1 Iron hydrogenase 1 [Sporotomaculum syntrophicum]